MESTWNCTVWTYIYIGHYLQRTQHIANRSKTYYQLEEMAKGNSWIDLFPVNKIFQTHRNVLKCMINLSAFNLERHKQVEEHINLTWLGKYKQHNKLILFKKRIWYHAASDLFGYNDALRHFYYKIIVVFVRSLTSLLHFYNVTSLIFFTHYLTNALRQREILTLTTETLTSHNSDMLIFNSYEETLLCYVYTW